MDTRNPGGVIIVLPAFKAKKKTERRKDVLRNLIGLAALSLSETKDTNSNLLLFHATILWDGSNSRVDPIQPIDAVASANLSLRNYFLIYHAIINQLIIICHLLYFYVLWI